MFIFLLSFRRGNEKEKRREKEEISTESCQVTSSVAVTGDAHQAEDVPVLGDAVRSPALRRRHVALAESVTGRSLAGQRHDVAFQSGQLSFDREEIDDDVGRSAF